VLALSTPVEDRRQPPHRRAVSESPLADLKESPLS